jgi:thermitase
MYVFNPIRRPISLSFGRAFWPQGKRSADRRSLASGLALIGTSLLVTSAGFTARATELSSPSETSRQEWLIKIVPSKSAGGLNAQVRERLQSLGTRMESLGELAGGEWLKVKSESKALNLKSRLATQPGVMLVQPNYRIRHLQDYQIRDSGQRERLARELMARGYSVPGYAGGLRPQAPADNPAIPNPPTSTRGADPEFPKQWGMVDNNVKNGWSGRRGEGMVVAVLDSGVDYTHEDLAENMWRNPGETGRDSKGQDRASNGVDDDGNGYIDDVVGWDFVTNDNKPYDLSVDPIQLLFGGGNPGHGTHCAGNVAARGENAIGVAGVAPKTQIMALRFLSEKGEGSTDAAIKAIQYATKMGVKISSNSWGSEGEDPSDTVGNQALRDAITEAMNAGQLFIAAAGNGHQGVGYDNDTDAKPAYPASYEHENIISVAALDKADALGSFSNWGKKSVDLGAPGVAVFSTTVGGKYSDTVIDMLGIKATWDGTSMAAPHVSGAAALYWADHPQATWREVKAAILKSVKPISTLNGKSVTGGKLNVDALMR